MLTAWLRLDFGQWCREVSAGRLSIPGGDLDYAAFTAIVSARTETAPDMRSLEAALPPSAFRNNVRLLLAQRGDPETVPSIFDKPAVLAKLQADPDPANAAEVYVVISRGWLVATPHTHTMPEAYKGNYVDLDEDDPALVAAVDAELSRGEQAGFIAPWDVVAVEDGCPGQLEPTLCHPVGGYLKPADPAATGSTDKPKARVFLDPGPSGLNNLGDDEEFTTKLASVGDARAAVQLQCPFWRSDFADAFLSHPVARGHARLLGLRWRGRYLAFRKMILGHRRSPRQMQATLVGVIRSYHRDLRTRGCPVGPDPEFHVSPPHSTPTKMGVHGGVTATPGYVDDAAGFPTSYLAAWYSFAVWLHTCLDPAAGWGIPLSFKADGSKTCVPRLRHVFLGFMIDAAEGTISVPIAKLRSTLAKVEHFLRAEARSGNTVQDALSVAGSLQHVFTVIPAGRGFYRSLMDTAMAVGREHRRRQITCADTVLDDLQAAHRLLRVLYSVNVRTGLRRLRLFGALYTDASLTGWSWHANAVGLIKSGTWPPEWQALIGPLSPLREMFITELEALCVLFAVRTLAPYAVGLRLVLHVDNEGVVAMLRKLATGSTRIRPIITEIAFVCAAFDVELDPHWVATARNTLADCGSRPERLSETACPHCGRTFPSELQQQRHWFEAHRPRPRTAPTPSPPVLPELLPPTVDGGLSGYGSTLSNMTMPELAALLPSAEPADDVVATPVGFTLR